MIEYLEKLISDIEDYMLPASLENLEKLTCRLYNGKRIYWYYTDDRDFFTEEGEDVKDHLKDIYSGIVVGVHDEEVDYSDLSYEYAMVVMDQYPIEKEYPQYTWVSMKRLLNALDLVEIFEKEEGKK